MELTYKTDSYATHQPILIELIKNTKGNILECGCGNGSTELIKELILNTDRKLISVESDRSWLEKFKYLENDNISIFHVDASNDDIESTGEKWIEFFENNELIKNTNFDIVFIDQSPWISRTYTLRYFQNKAKFIIIHDANYYPDYGKWGKIENSNYDFSDIADNFIFFSMEYPPTLLLSNTLSKEEFEKINIDITKYY